MKFKQASRILMTGAIVMIASCSQKEGISRNEIDQNSNVLHSSRGLTEEGFIAAEEAKMRSDCHTAVFAIASEISTQEAASAYLDSHAQVAREMRRAFNDPVQGFIVQGQNYCNVQSGYFAMEINSSNNKTQVTKSMIGGLIKIAGIAGAVIAIDSIADSGGDDYNTQGGDVVGDGARVDRSTSTSTSTTDSNDISSSNTESGIGDLIDSPETSLPEPEVPEIEIPEEGDI